MKEFTHVPVLLEEAIAGLNLKPGAIVVDATFGRGGHSREILKSIGKNGKIVGVDRDRLAINIARNEWRDQRLILAHSRFSQIAEVLDANNIPVVDAVLMDLGMSSLQLDDDRGFSWQNTSVDLDLRMGLSDMTAATILNEYDETELHRVFRDYSDIFSKKFIKNIVSFRRAKEFNKTGDLLKVVRQTFSKSERNVYARIWQALRIEVNNEMGELRLGLRAAVKRLRVGGRLAVISFHSVEDRMVKNFMREKSTNCHCPPEIPQCVCDVSPSLKIITKKAIRPTQAEIIQNIRSKSARLRVAEKI